MVNVQNKCYEICDNQVYVNELTLLLNDDYHSLKLHKST